MKHNDICKWYDACLLKRFYEQSVLDKRWVENYCWGDYLRCVRYKIEEKGSYHPDNMMPNDTVDKKLR